MIADNDENGQDLLLHTFTPCQLFVLLFLCVVWRVVCTRFFPGRQKIIKISQKKSVGFFLSVLLGHSSSRIMHCVGPHSLCTFL